MADSVRAPVRGNTRVEVQMRGDGTRVVHKRSRSALTYEAEKRVLQILAEEGFPAPRLLGHNDERQTLVMEFCDGPLLDDALGSASVAGRRELARLAVATLGRLEGILTGRQDELRPVASHLNVYGVSGDEEADDVVAWWADMLTRGARLAGDDSFRVDSDIRERLKRAIVTLFSGDQNLSVSELGPWHALVSGNEVVFFDFEFIRRDWPERRLARFGVQNLTASAAPRPSLLDSETISAYLDAARSTGLDIDLEPFIERLCAAIVVNSLRGLSMLVEMLVEMHEEMRARECSSCLSALEQKWRLAAMRLSAPLSRIPPDHPFQQLMGVLREWAGLAATRLSHIESLPQVQRSSD